MLSAAGSNLKTLKISNISAALIMVTYSFYVTLQPLFESIKKGCPKLESLDVSKNKFTRNDGVALIGYLESANSLTELNLSGCKVPGMFSHFLIPFS